MPRGVRGALARCQSMHGRYGCPPRESRMNITPEVQAATTRYSDSLGPAVLQKAHDYTIGKEWMLLWALVVAAVVTWLIVRSGLLDKLDRKLDEKRRNLRAFVIGLAFVVISTVLTLPWTLYADYFREKGYGRTSQPLGDWLGQFALSGAINALITAGFLPPGFLPVRGAPQNPGGGVGGAAVVPLFCLWPC